MPRRLPALILACALVGSLMACAEDRPRRPIQLLGQAVLSGPEAEVVVVAITDIPPGTVVESITLVGPTGQRLVSGPFFRGNRESGSSGVSHGIGLIITGGSSSKIRTGASYGTFATGVDDTVASQTITAEISLPDPQGYLSTAARWYVDVAYRDITGSARNHRIPAPQGLQ